MWLPSRLAAERTFRTRTPEKRDTDSRNPGIGSSATHVTERKNHDARGICRNDGVLNFDQVELLTVEFPVSMLTGPGFVEYNLMTFNVILHGIKQDLLFFCKDDWKIFFNPILRFLVILFTFEVMLF